MRDLFLNISLFLICGSAFGQIEIHGDVICEISGERPISDIYVSITNSKKPIVDSMVIIDDLGKFQFKNLEPNKEYTLEVLFGIGMQKFIVKTKNGISNVNLELKAECEYTVDRAESDWKKGEAKLLLFGSIAPIANSSADNRFEKKFSIKYFDFGCTPPIEECIKIYNEKIFELMDEKFGIKWRKKVRDDVEYLK